MFEAGSNLNSQKYSVSSDLVYSDVTSVFTISTDQGTLKCELNNKLCFYEVPHKTLFCLIL